MITSTGFYSILVFIVSTIGAGIAHDVQLVGIRTSLIVISGIIVAGWIIALIKEQVDAFCLNSGD